MILNESRRLWYYYNSKKYRAMREQSCMALLMEVSGVPRKPKQPCAYPGCPRLSDGRYCEEHRKAAAKQYNQYGRSPDSNKKYGRSWRVIRERYAAAHPLCERCLKDGRLTPVEEVHHILPVSQGGTNDASNLMSLCQSCHTKIHLELGDRKAYG